MNFGGQCKYIIPGRRANSDSYPSARRAPLEVRNDVVHCDVPETSCGIMSLGTPHTHLVYFICREPVSSPKVQNENGLFYDTIGSVAVRYVLSTNKAPDVPLRSVMNWV